MRWVALSLPPSPELALYRHLGYGLILKSLVQMFENTKLDDPRPFQI